LEKEKKKEAEKLVGEAAEKAAVRYIVSRSHNEQLKVWKVSFQTRYHRRRIQNWQVKVILN
jgi:hypothetical protein